LKLETSGEKCTESLTDLAVKVAVAHPKEAIHLEKNTVDGENGKIGKNMDRNILRRNGLKV